MNYIKFIVILILHFSLVQVTLAQSASTDENGRTNAEAANKTKVETPALSSPSIEEDMSKGHDFDIGEPLLQQVEENDWVLPNDLDEMRDEISASGPINNEAIRSRLNALEAELNKLKQYNEMLRLENRSIRRSVGGCCTEVKAGLKASDAYLLQNAPNPFNASADIQYFIPDGVQRAKLEVRDIKGILLKSFDITESGINSITLDAKEIASGTCIYALIIDGEIIDSKVMILTK